MSEESDHEQNTENDQNEQNTTENDQNNLRKNKICWKK